jgi:uncharacterized delta-60 repeat protein
MRALPSVNLPQRAAHGLRRPAFLLAVLLLALLLPLTAGARDGDLDTTFGRLGKVKTDFQHSADVANAVAIQADGKLVVAGTSYLGNNFSGEDFALLRYLPDGTVDKSFGRRGRATTNFPNLAAQISAVVIQPDQKIVVAGGAYPLLVSAGNFVLARYLPDGTLDSGFGTGGIVTTHFPMHGSYASALALQADGKIVAAGTYFVNFSTDDSSNTDFALARYNEDGTPDTSFGQGGQLTTDFDGFNDDAFALLVQPDGKLVAVGSAKNPSRFYDFALARYRRNGQLDKSFGEGGKVRTDFGKADFDRARSAVLQPDGKIVAVGFTIFDGGGTQPFAAARYAPDGSLDPGFGNGGLLQITFGSIAQTAYQVLLQPDGKLVMVGFPSTESSDSDFLLARCWPDGSLDPDFGVGGKVRTSFGKLNGGARGAALHPDGRIVAAGFQATAGPRSVQVAVARYLGGGAMKVKSPGKQQSHGRQ